MAFTPENTDVTRILKDILRIGTDRPSQTNSSESSSTVTLPATVQEVIEGIDDKGLNRGMSEDTDSFAQEDTDSFAQSSMDKMGASQSLNWTTNKQQILLQGGDSYNPYIITSQNVDIIASKASGSTTPLPVSNKVFVTPVVKYDWEHKYYAGKLLAVHQNQSYVAYALKNANKKSGIVRVFIPLSSSGERISLNCFDGLIVDMDFAHSTDVLLGVIDEKASFYVFKIATSGLNQLQSQILVKVSRPPNDPPPIKLRLVWCSYIPNKDECHTDNDASPETLLIQVVDDMVHLWHIETINKKYGDLEMQHDRVKSGHLVIEKHPQAIVDTVSSPDGSTLATACLDGFVRFYDIDMSDPTQTKLIFKWSPHDGRPLSSIVFLDDHKNIAEDTKFWQGAITGADDNREFKVWNCETWTCIQTVNMCSAANVPVIFQMVPCVKAQIDVSASCLVLSDIKRKVLYTLHLHKDTHSGMTYISSVSEYLLAHPCLSFAVVDISSEPGNFLESDGHLRSLHDSSDQDHSVLTLYAIQTKALQKFCVQLAHDPLDFSHNSSRSGEPLMPYDPLNIFTSQSAGSTRTSSDARVDCQSPVMTARSAEPSVYSHSSSFTHISSLDEGKTSISVRESLDAPALSSPHSVSQMPSTRDFHSTNTHLPSRVDAAALLTPALSGSEFFTSSPLVHKSFGESASLPTPGSSGQPFLQRTVKYEPHGVSLGNLQSHVDPHSKAALFHPGENADTKSQESIHETQNTRKLNPAQPGSDLVKHGRDIDSSRGETNITEVHMVPGQSVIGLPAANHNSLSSIKRESTGVGELHAQLREIIQMLKGQQEVLNIMKQQTDSAVLTSLNDLQGKIDNLQTSLNTLTHQSQSLHLLDNRSVERMLAEREKMDEEKHQKLLMTLSQSIDVNIKDRLESSINDQIDRAVMPGINQILEPVTQKFNADLVQKLTATDSLLKENVRQIVRSKQITDEIRRAAASNLETILHSTCRDVLIPSFDRGCQNIFSQLDVAFKKGLQQYSQQVESCLDSVRKKQTDIHDPVVFQIQSIIDGLKQSNDAKQPLLKELNNLLLSVRRYSEQVEKQRFETTAAVDKNFSRLPLYLSGTVRQIVRQEVSSALKVHRASIGEKISATLNSSSVGTPMAQHHNIQQQQANLLLLIKNGQLNAAFQQALVAQDLYLLTFVCESVSPAFVFGQDCCPLDQSVLLSLIQQLSTELTGNASLKCKYLEEALLNIDLENLSMNEMRSTVLKQLCKNLDRTMHSPMVDGGLKRSMRMIHMTAQSLLQSSST